jgi:GTP-binding protein
VIASKIDAAQDRQRIESVRKMAKQASLPFYEISSVTGEGIEPLKFAMAQIALHPAEERPHQI